MENKEPIASETVTTRFAMVAKTFQGLEDLLADEIRALPGAQNVEPGRRMVSFDGTLETMYRANMQCRTALRILKPICSFKASDPDELYSRVKEFDWGSVLSVGSTFSIDSGAVYSDEFTNSLFVTYRVKDAIVDWFQDRLGQGKRPGVRLQDADACINVHISGHDVTLSLDSSGESLHKRGYRVAQTEAPINEVLAAGIILRSGWRGDQPFVDPMCGSGTFLIEAAMIAAGIMPGVYRSHFAFETWPDFDRDLFESIYNDDSAERIPACGIYGADISPKAIAIAERNIKQAGVGKYITLEAKALSKWTEAPEEGRPGVLITNPPYGERISVDDMSGLYSLIGAKLKELFKGYHAWIIGYRDEYFNEIGLRPSLKLPVLNGKLECELREYILFDGDMKSFKRSGGSTLTERRPEKKEPRRDKSRDKKDAPRPGAYTKVRVKQREDESDEDFAHRRRQAILKSIVGKRPSLPPSDQETQTRKGWRRK
ncbi:MAG: THUMP domain-containing protein [Pseudoflavonifractor sp.]|nr:THUMP domain-containing protein [Alloprevotella sp.]MCM1116986.1 THUMP domain-containing protein [Pseudoflavonifractor sp.]